MKKAIRYLNPKNLFEKIELYGYKYSWKKYLFFLIGSMVIVVGVAKVLGLTLTQILLLLLVFLVFSPKIILNTYGEMYEEKKFVDVSNYLEQMLYSFRRKSKIITALEDASLLFSEGLMFESIEKTLEHVTVLETEGDFYKEAFSLMESKYSCDIVKRVHEFMARVEMSGGEHVDSADILIADRNRWVTRVLSAQKEKKLVKRNVTIGIFLSLVVIVGTVMMVPIDLVDASNNIISQISSWITLVMNFLLWIFVQTKLSGSWISSENTVSEEQLQRYYTNLVSPKKENQIVKIILNFSTLLICGYLSLLRQEILWLLAGVIVMSIVSTNYQRALKMNKKRLSREVQKAFPDWMMSLSLLLQTENVQGAIQRSIDYAPIVLKAELQILQEKIEQQPTSIEPYIEFYDSLHLVDIQSSMRMLYSMSQSGGEEMSKQINALIERNVELQDQSERIKTEDYLAGISFCVLIPMLIGCGKMLVDMGLLMFSLLNTSQGFF